MKRHYKRISVFIIIYILLISTIAIAGQLSVHFLDVGQADSILLQLPNGQNMLIDAGNNADGPFVVNYLKDQGITTIDYLIGTHPHEDHIGGIDNVILKFNIGHIYMPKITTNTKTFEDVLLAIKEKNKTIITAKAGVSVIEQDNLKAYFLSPFRNNYEELNEWSAVLKVVYGKTSFLFAGDAEELNEFEILASSARKPDADVLKVGHHGSDTSTSEAFLEGVSPSYAVISVGANNRYGHPSKIVLHRLQEHGATVMRTDDLGTIIASSDGETVRFNKITKKIKPLPQESDKPKIVILNANLKDELVEIKNNEESVINLNGWKLVSVKGNQEFFFPDINIEPGEIISIDSGPGATSGPNKLKWTGRYIWNNDGDPAELYDNQGNLISELY